MFFESPFLKQGDSFFAAIDEVGRGPLAGPVVAACVWIIFHGHQGQEKKSLEEILSELMALGVGDSKKIGVKKRKKIVEHFKCEKIQASELVTFKACPLYSFGVTLDEVHAQEIDRINILQSSLKAMKKSVEKTISTFGSESLRGEILVDGNKLFEWDEKSARGSKMLRRTSVIKGDQKSFLIGLASIIAKFYRDQWMIEASSEYPGYELEKHAGYPTAAHRLALKKLGPSSIHRKSFRGVC